MSCYKINKSKTAIVLLKRKIQLISIHSLRSSVTYLGIQTVQLLINIIETNNRAAAQSYGCQSVPSEFEFEFFYT